MKAEQTLVSAERTADTMTTSLSFCARTAAFPLAGATKFEMRWVKDIVLREQGRCGEDGDRLQANKASAGRVHT